ncbi:hypothetical protein ACHHYP_00938 [Achlya hypogyna]|uniref:Rhodanese domain-containing protein n=1 Tax=Achlya hypogyna TaxID=1202772 RepID=A0A1V9Z9W8_ACHHY|nr:hypothetical protein ACHHYP_00938 [Achlya hypogyna]
MGKEVVDESVLAANYTHDAHEILASIKETKSRKFSDLGNDAPSPEVGYYGGLGHKLQQLLHDMQAQLSLPLVIELFVTFGNDFFLIHEYTVGQVLFGRALELYTNIDAPTLVAQLLHIRARYASTLCSIQQLQLRDARVAYPSTLAALVVGLKALQSGLAAAVGLAVSPQVQADKSAHAACIGHVLQGSVHIMSVCTPLQTLGFEADVLPYMKYATLALDSLIHLCTVQFIAWRCHIYMAIAAAYDALALKHPTKRDALWKSAVAALDMGLKRVQRLRQEEELDLPLPEATDATLKAAERDLLIARFPLVKCAKATGAPLQLAVSRSDIDAAFADPVARVRAMLKCLAVRSPSQWVYFGHWISDAEAPPVVALSTADADALLTALLTLDAVMTVDEHALLLKLCFRYRHWDHFVATHVALAPRLDGPSLARAETELFHAFFELVHDTPRVDVRALKVAEIDALVQHLAAAARNSRLCALRRDVLAEMILALWHAYVCPVLALLDERLLGAPRLGVLERAAKDLLFAVHRVAHAIDLDDVVWRATVALRLGRLLADVDDPRVGVQVLRSSLDVVARARSTFVDATVHTEVTATAAGRAQLHSAACGASIAAQAYVPPDGPTRGSVFQQQHLNRLVACLETDLALLLYELEYDDLSSAVTRHPARAVLALEARLLAECNKNDYRRGLLLLQAARRRAKGTLAIATTSHSAIVGREEQDMCLAEALVCFDAMRADERDRREAAEPPEVVPHAHMKPAAPRLATRGSMFVTLRLAPFKPLRRTVAYFMLYGKVTGAGTDVSLNNMGYPGTGTAIDPQHPEVTVTGLLPNESYVFAVAAYDVEDNLIEGIGATSRPVLTLHPHVLPYCYGLLAHVACDLHHMGIAAQAATAMYSEFVAEAPTSADSDRWRCNPLFAHALRLERIPDAAPRGAIAEYPMQVLHVFLRALSILIGPELGCAEMDGRLPEAVVSAQLHVLSMINKGMLALEVAALTGHAEYMAAVAHRLYRLMVPLLHLPSSGGLLLQPLVMILETLQIVPEKHWDDALHATYMCTAYELLRLATEKGEFKAVQACLKLKHESLKHVNAPLLPPFQTPRREAQGLRDTIFLQSHWMEQLDLSAATVITAAPEDKGKVAKATPRDDTKASELHIEEALPSLAHMAKAAADLRTYFVHHRDYVPYICRVAHLGLVRGEKGVDAVLHGVHWSSRLHLSPAAKELLQHLQLHSLVPDPPVAEPPASARPDGEGHMADAPPPATPRDVVLDVSDREVYLWSGQICFLRAMVHSAALFPVDDSPVNYVQGPDHDLSWLYLSPPEAPLPPTYGSIEGSACNESAVALLREMAPATQLFYHARAWPSLVEAVRGVWNGLWAAWVSPLAFHDAGYDWRPLFVCVMRLLDMLDSTTFGVTYDDVDVLARELDAVDIERPPVASTAALQAAAQATPDLDLAWVVRLAVLALQVLCTAREWQRLVVLGKRVHVLCGGVAAFSELVLPWVVFAQAQRTDAQVALVRTTAADLAAFVKAFEDAQAKKKKKRSRLVVHEVVSDEERAFLDERAAREAHVTALMAFQRVLHAHGALLQSWLDLLNRSKSMCLQALQRAEKCVTRRLVLNDADVDWRDVLTAFKACVGLCRQKRATLLLTQALMEQGDYLFAEDDRVGAAKAWTDAVDAVFGALDATLHWRELLADPGRLTQDGDGMLCTLLCVHVLGKLAWTTHGDNVHARLECALLGSAVFSKFFTSSLPHPDVGRPATFAPYTPMELLPTIASLPLKLAHPASLVLAITTLVETLLSQKQFVEALPLATGLGVLTARYMRDARGAMLAQRMKAEACIGAGYMSCACTLLTGLLGPPIAFVNAKRVGDCENEAAFRWLCDFSVERAVAELLPAVGIRAAHLVALTVLRWMAALAGHEGPTPQGAALKSALNQAAAALQASATKAPVALSDAQPSPTKPSPREAEAAVAPEPETLDARDVAKLSCECDLLVSSVALQDGLVETARTVLARCMKLYEAQPKVSVDDSSFTGLSTELNMGFWLQCRLVGVRCDVAQGHYDDAIALVGIALDEAQTVKDRVVSRQLRALRVQASLLRGNRASALDEARVWVAKDDLALPLPARVEVLAGLSACHRTDAMSAASPTDHVAALRESVAAIVAAVATTNALLERQGWMGLKYTPAQARLVNVYHPFVSIFVVVKTLYVARSLDLYRASPAEVNPGALLPSIQDALTALGHVCSPPNHLRPLLLFFKGAVLRRSEGGSAAEATDAFTEALALWIKDGGHPRQLMHAACMELVVLFGDCGDTPASCHYLQLACKLQDQLHTLWNTSALNATSATGLGTLPPFLQQEILASAKTTAAAPTMEQLGYLVLPYFVAIAREHDVVFDLALAAQLHRSHSTLHAFLAANHAGYAKLCLSGVPPVPKDSPEIPGGLVCVQWLQTAPEAGAMYYVLGTATHAHDTRFADAPILSRKCDLNWSAVRAVKGAIARLRHKLQDKEDRVGKVQGDLDSVLAQISLLFQGEESSGPHAIGCTLDDVALLERVFCTSRGINAPHNAICYFLRRALATPETPRE